MVIRLFLALLVLNMLAFVVRAEAADAVELNKEPRPDNLYLLQEQMSGDFERDNTDAVTEIGSRLLSLSLVSRQDQGRRYASEAIRPDHGVALLEEGACLNFKWNF